MCLGTSSIRGDSQCYWHVAGIMFIGMDVFMLPVTVKSNDLFSLLGRNNSPVVPHVLSLSVVV